MMIRYPDVLQLAGSASHTFAPALSSLEPTVPEAIEEHARAKKYRDDSLPIGLLVGGALGIATLFLRRR